LATQQHRFGKYTLGGKVAQGGMAEIFRARFKAGPDITKQVIIKRILPKYAENERFIQMFATEARIAMGFAHGNIAQVFDFGEIDGAWFLAMELVDGQSLSRVLKAAKAQGIPSLPPHLAAMVISDMLKGLHYAHTRIDDDGQPLNIVHRDVSPQNVLVSYEGQVKLVDFGIAKARHATDKTQAGVIKGKYLYFSPEQVNEKPLDGRTDVFAAGAVLYQLLTGHHPFKGEVHDVMRAIVRGNLTPPSEKNPEIPPELEAVVLKAMATRLEDRYQSAADFERALSGWLHSAAPDASADELASLMQLLFATELAAEGRPIQPDPHFVEVFNSWKRDAEDDDQITSETKSERSEKSKSKSKSVRKSSHSSSMVTVKKPVPRAVYGIFALLCALAGVAIFKLLEPPPTFSLKVTSSTPGAQVRVDGNISLGSPPAFLKELPAHLPHTVRVTAPGMKPWEMEARGEPGGTTMLHAELVPAPPREPEPPPTPVTPAVPAKLEPIVVNEVNYPAGVVKVLAKRHTKSLEKSEAARVELDPKKTYKFTVEGKVSFGGKVQDIWVDDFFYVLVGPGVTHDNAYGVLGEKKPLTVTGASRLYAFISDINVKRHSGAFRVTYQARGEAPQRMLVDSMVHNIFPEPNERLTIVNLRVLDHYKLTVRQGTEPAHFLARGKRVQVLFSPEAGQISPFAKATDRRPHRVFEIGKSYDISGTTNVWFWFPDDDPSDNGGELEVSLEVNHDVVDFGAGMWTEDPDAKPAKKTGKHR
jgi:eukaryotic-like serine/threonine-protein kinase